MSIKMLEAVRTSLTVYRRLYYPQSNHSDLVLSQEHAPSSLAFLLLVLRNERHFFSHNILVPSYRPDTLPVRTRYVNFFGVFGSGAYRACGCLGNMTVKE